MTRTVFSAAAILMLPAFAWSSSDLNSRLLEAASEGDLAAVQLLISRDADVNSYASDGVTPVYAAARSGHLGVVKFLVKRGAKLGPIAPFDLTPLYAAAAKGRLAEVKYLLEAGADPLYKNKIGQTAASVACRDASSSCPKEKILELFAAKEREWAALRAAEEARKAAEAAKQRAIDELAGGRIVWQGGTHPTVPLPPDSYAETHSVWETLAAAVSEAAKRDFENSVGEKPAVPPVFTQSKYESQSRFENRVEDARREYQQSLADHNRRVGEYRLSPYRGNEILQDALGALFGQPQVVQTAYDADRQVFAAKVGSDPHYFHENGFAQNFLLTQRIPNETAQDFDEALQKATPRLVFQHEGSKLTVVSAEFDVLGKTYAALPTKKAVAQKPIEVDLSSLDTAPAAASARSMNISYAESPRLASPEAVPSLDRPLFAPRPERPHDFAVVVGVEFYNDAEVPQAEFAERDADAVAAYLRALGVPKKNVIQLKGKEATYGKLRGYLDSWLPKNVSEDSRVYFYFSGHGAPEPAKGDAYLLSWDGDPRFLEQTALSLNSVYGALGKLKSKQVLVAMDACFSGTGSRSVREKGARPLVTVHLGAAQPNTTVLAAAQTDEIAQSLQDERHGIFTYYLLKGLDEGSKDSDALCAYLAPKVKEAAAHRNRIQTPVCNGPTFGF